MNIQKQKKKREREREKEKKKFDNDPEQWMTASMTASISASFLVKATHSKCSATTLEFN